jgi:hypothetical protein
MKRALPYILITAGLLFIALGIWGDEVQVVLSRATNICLECIGIG